MTPELRDDLLRRLALGAGLAEAARQVGVHPRTLRAWRARAWSPRPEDRAYVELEQHVRNALGAAERAAESWTSTAELLEPNERQWRELEAELN